MSSFLNEFVIRCMRCGWLFRSFDRYRTKCRACESRVHTGGTNGDHTTNSD